MADELVVEEAVPTEAPVTGSGPEVTPEGAGEEQLPEEPYGAQLLRKLHEDAALLLMEYDAAMGPLDNPDVRAYVTDVMKLIDKQVLSAAEKCFKKSYKQLPPLVPEDTSGEAGTGEEVTPEEGAEEVVEEEPADMPPDGAPPSGDEVVEEEGEGPPEGPGAKDYDDGVDADSGARDDAPAGSAMRGMYKNGKALPRGSDPSKYRTDPATLEGLRDPEEQYTFLLGDDTAQFVPDETEHLHAGAAPGGGDTDTGSIFSTPSGKPRTHGAAQGNFRRTMEGLADTQGKKPHARASVAESRLRKLPSDPREVDAMLEGLKDPAAKSLLHSISPLPGGKGFRVVESCGTKARHVDLTVKGVNKYLSGFKGRGAKSLLDAVAKGLNGGKAVRFKSALPCEQCHSSPCVCSQGKTMPGTEKWEDYPLEELNGHDPDVDPTNAESGTSPPWFTALLPEAQKLDEAFGQLTDLAEATTTWDELMRHKSFHYHKSLEGAYLKCASGCGYKGMEDEGDMDPDAVKHLKALAAASSFFKALALSKDFGDPHRREAKFHAGNVKELLKAMGVGPEPTPQDHAEATFAEPGEMGEKNATGLPASEKDLDEMAGVQEASAKALCDLAKALTGEKSNKQKDEEDKNAGG